MISGIKSNLEPILNKKLFKSIAEYAFELTWMTLLLAVLFFSLVGCGQNGQVEGQGFAQRIEVAKPVEIAKIKKSIITEVQEVNQTDVLIVVDNSASMRFEQASMAAKFSSLLEQLKGLNWRLGIITTDMSGNAPKKDGRLLELAGLPGQFYLDHEMNTSVIEEAFSKTIQRPSREGSANEQGLNATWRAIERGQEFFRTNGSLNVIVVADADETAPKGSKPNIRNNPSELLKFVNETYPKKPFYFHSIIVQEGDETCLKGSDNESYGRQYAWLSNKTNGLVGNVCADDYAGQLKMIGEKVSQKVVMQELGCQPVLESISIKSSLNSLAPAFEVQGTQMLFAEPLSPGVWTTDFECENSL